jgi:hypothetical protein
VVVSGGATGTCKKRKVCSEMAPPANGNAGDPCSNGASPTFPDGAGTNLTCPCKTGYVCADAQDKVVSGAASGVCKLKKTCADYSALGNVGNTCHDQSFFSDGFGTLFACPCKLTGGLGNNKCVGATASAAGTCQCVKTACTCVNTGLTDGCGGTLSCACPPTQKCNTTANPPTCCPTISCTALPPSVPAGACGAIPDPCMGGSISCACDTSGGKTNNKCVITSGTYGSCVCQPLTCLDYPGKTGPQPDGCGGFTPSCTG